MPIYELTAEQVQRTRLYPRKEAPGISLRRQLSHHQFLQFKVTLTFVIISVLVVTMEVVVLKVIGKLGDGLDGVVVGQGVCRLPEGTIPPLHRYHG